VDAARHPAGEVFLAFLKLGLSAFGGPVAHLGYFRDEFVMRRRWLDDAAYGDLVALWQVLPGPASSQVGMSIGLLRAGLPGMAAAWTGFTLPSAAALMLLAGVLADAGGGFAAGWLHGLQVAAVAIVANAVWGMGRTLCPDRLRASIAGAATLIALAWPGSFGQIAAILLAAVVGWRWIAPATAAPVAAEPAPMPHRLSLLPLGLFVALLFFLPLAADLTANHGLALVDRFYRAGALVFGGGHVVLPLLQAAVVPPGWIDNDRFLAGYGAAQAVPGPLFTFAAFLGTTMRPAPDGPVGGLLCLGAIYLPSFLLVPGALPLWRRLSHGRVLRAAVAGINAGVVGLLLAALYTPVWTSSIHAASDFGLAVAALIAIAVWRLPPWLVVAGCLLAGNSLAALQ